MKSFIRSLVITAVSLYAVSLIIPGVSFQNGLRGLAITVIILTLINRLIKPLVSLLLLPINLLTLGAFRWLTNVAVFYLVSFFSPDFTITGFNIPQIPFHFGHFWAIVITAFLFNLFQSTLRWFFH